MALPFLCWIVSKTNTITFFWSWLKVGVLPEFEWNFKEFKEGIVLLKKNFETPPDSWHPTRALQVDGELFWVPIH